MPWYDYHCSENGQTLEVSHSIHDRVTTWSRLCELAGVEPGSTRGDTPVERCIPGEVGIVTGARGSTSPRSAPPGGACHRPGGCGCH